jgi:putative ABC transport system substrate-binding protein
MRAPPTALTVLLTIALLAAPLAAAAPPAGKVPRIGFLGSTSASDPRIGPMIEAFRQGLRDLGYVEGRTIVIESRWDEGKIDRLPVLAAELVGLKVDVLVAGGAPAMRAAQQATRAIPIVMTAVSDPVALGFVASLARPGGNSTGSGYMGPETATKKLELLKETVPRITRVAVLFDPDGPTGQVTLTAMEPVARALGLTLQPVGVRSPDDFTGAFSAMAAGRADALTLLPDAVILMNVRRLADLAIKQRLPSVGFREWPDAGGLIAYGVDLVPMYRGAATFVDKILKGAKPGDLPVEQATRFQLILNMKTAKALGITFPQSVLLRADQVIE